MDLDAEFAGQKARQLNYGKGIQAGCCATCCGADVVRPRLKVVHEDILEDLVHGSSPRNVGWMVMAQGKLVHRVAFGDADGDGIDDVKDAGVPGIRSPEEITRTNRIDIDAWPPQLTMLMLRWAGMSALLTAGTTSEPMPPDAMSAPSWVACRSPGLVESRPATCHRLR
jgi:hypothetical protein